MSDDLQTTLDRQIDAYRKTLASAQSERLLFSGHAIRGRIPHVPLADGVPTPITPIESGYGTLWVKRDDLTSTLYGGNKVRKLEFVLAAALDRGCTPVVVGATASHQVLATALYTRLLEMDCEAVLFPQPPTPEETVVSAVLEAFDIPVSRSSTANMSPLTTARALLGRPRGNGRRCLIYPGSSSPAGILGYVDCGLEIAGSVRSGVCPEPDAVFTAFGTGGTAVGLAIGLMMGGLESLVYAVRVADATVSNQWHLRNLEWRTRRLLHSLDVECPSAFRRLHVLAEYLGDGYGYPLPAASTALDLARSTGLPIDQTYTAKALAAALDHQRRTRRDSVMFIETLSAVTPDAGMS